MVFSSIVFLCVFLPVVFLLYYAIPSVKAKNILLIAASLLFYAYGEPVYVFLMLVSTVMNYLFGRWIGQSEDRTRSLLLFLDVLLNLGMLGVFKYADMAVGAVNAVFQCGFRLPGIELPIGISFFTFQAMSYVIDVYRGQVQAQKKYINILLYISFFPQLIAGPIVKYHDIEKQIQDRSFELSEVTAGFKRFIVGLSKKVLISNVMASAADAIFAMNTGDMNILSAWIGAIAYMMQIYYDFSGYSDMAIGMGHMFGFTFQENFRYPYSSVTIQEFWRRWHISLSTWFKEYLYIPLGGNRMGKVRTCINKLIVFFTTGLWHGANWTFVVWGLFHGAFLLLEEWIPVKKLPRFLGHVYSLLVVCVGFVVFRADTLTQGFAMIRLMFTGFRFDAAFMVPVMNQLTPLFIVVLAAAFVLAFPVTEKIQEKMALCKTKTMELFETAAYAGSILLLILCMVSLAGGTYNPFIYFRF